MRGQACSWKEMQRIREHILPLIQDHGEGKLAAEFRCVDQQTVYDWQRASEIMEVLDDIKTRISAFQHIHPSQLNFHWFPEKGAKS